MYNLYRTNGLETSWVVLGLWRVRLLNQYMLAPHVCILSRCTALLWSMGNVFEGVTKRVRGVRLRSPTIFDDTMSQTRALHDSEQQVRRFGCRLFSHVCVCFESHRNAVMFFRGNRWDDSWDS